MLRRAALAALLVPAFAAPALADAQGEAMLRELLAAIDATPEWAAAAGIVRSEGDETIAERIALTREDPRVAVTIDLLGIDDLSPGDGGGFSADSIRLVGARLDADQISYAVPAASVRDVSVPGVQQLAFDPAHLMTFVADLYAVMARSEFADLSVPEMRVEQAGGEAAAGADSTAVYRNLTSTRLADGVLDRLALGPVEIVVEAPEGGTTRLAIAEMSAGRLDVGALAHVLDASAYRDGRGDGVWRPLVSSVRYAGFAGSGPDGSTFAIEEVAVENVDGRQTDTPMLDLWDRLLDPAIPEDAKADMALDAVRQMYSAWRFGTIRVGGVAIDAADESTAFSLRELTVSGLSSDGFDSVILSGMAAAAPGGFGTFEQLELAGFVFPDIDALMQFAALENDAPDRLKEETIRATFAALPRLQRFAIQGVSGGAARDQAVTLGSLTLDLRDWNELFAEFAELRVEALDIPRDLLELDEQTSAMFDALGFDRLVLGMSFSDRWQPQSGTSEMQVGFSIREAMQAELSYTLTGLTMDWVFAAISAAGQGEDGEAALMAMVDSLALREAMLKVTDRSILDRAFGVAAQKQGLSVDGPTYRQQMRGALPFLLSAAAPPDLVKLLSKPLQDFMGGGRTLVAEIDPETPLPLPDLAGLAEMDPMRIPARVGLQLRTEDAPAR